MHDRILFSGKWVNLRAIKEEDLPLAVEYLNDPEIIMNADDDPPMPTSIEKQKLWLADYNKTKGIKDGVEFAIETKDGKYIGSCGTNVIDFKNRIAKVGIFIGPRENLGKGYGSDAMKLLVDFLFKEMNMNKITLNVFGYNKRAVRSYEKCGFKLEAVGREAMYRYGRYHDEYTMSILREEYTAQYEMSEAPGSEGQC